MGTDQDLRALSGMANGKVVVLVGNQPFVMGLLNPADYIEAANWRTQQKIGVILSAAPIQLAIDPTPIKGEAIANLLSKPVSPFDLLSDIEGVCRLAEIALQRGGEFKGNWEGFKRNLDKTTYRDLERAVFAVSGFKLPTRKATEEVADSVNPTLSPTAAT